MFHQQTDEYLFRVFATSPSYLPFYDRDNVNAPILMGGYIPDLPPAIFILEDAGSLLLRYILPSAY